jgi:hypothetical protein
MHWLTLDWWKYLFGKGGDDVNIFVTAYCRATGHASVRWYNPGGLEPDMHCNRCGDDLG